MLTFAGFFSAARGQGAARARACVAAWRGGVAAWRRGGVAAWRRGVAADQQYLPIGDWSFH